LGQLFQENNIEATRINYFNEPFTKETLRKLICKTDLKPFDLLRKADPAFKKLKLSNETAESEIIEAIISNLGLLQRPIIEIGEKAIVARPIEKALGFINGTD
jgi:arsenate reductase